MIEALEAIGLLTIITVGAIWIVATICAITKGRKQ
jgi:hypothetical protein